MHHFNHTSSLAAIALAGCLLASSPTASADSPPPEAKSARITGVWKHTVTFRDCDTGAVLRDDFPALNTFHTDNTVSEQGFGVSGAIRSLSHGYWRRSGARTFVDRVEFYIFDATGLLTNRQVTTRTIELAEDGRTSTVTGVLQRYTLDGLPTFRFCSTETGERLPEPQRP